MRFEQNYKKQAAQPPAGEGAREADTATVNDGAALTPPKDPGQGTGRLDRGLALGDDALVAEAEAEVLRRLANGVGVDPTRFRDDGPDPLGTDWAWADAPNNPKRQG